jgi:hypothetical protein
MTGRDLTRPETFNASADPNLCFLRVGQLRARMLSDRVTLHSALEEKGGVSPRPLTPRFKRGVVFVDGEGGQGAPGMATSGRWALAPATVDGDIPDNRRLSARPSARYQSPGGRGAVGT